MKPHSHACNCYGIPLLFVPLMQCIVIQTGSTGQTSKVRAYFRVAERARSMPILLSLLGWTRAWDSRAPRRYWEGTVSNFRFDRAASIWLLLLWSYVRILQSLGNFEPSVITPVCHLDALTKPSLHLPASPDLVSDHSKSIVCEAELSRGARRNARRCVVRSKQHHCWA